MTTYANFDFKRASLNEKFGQEFLARRAGQELADYIIARLPRYSRGKRKGQLKGFLHWRKCVSGGWVKYGPGEGNGGVVLPNTIDRMHVSFLWHHDEDNALHFISEFVKPEDKEKIDFVREKKSFAQTLNDSDEAGIDHDQLTKDVEGFEAEFAALWQEKRAAKVAELTAKQIKGDETPEVAEAIKETIEQIVTAQFGPKQ